MNSNTTRRRNTTLGLCLALAVAAGCSSDPAAPIPRIDGVSYAKAPSGPGVSSTNPDFGHGGDVSLHVTINGSGFANGAQPAWERNGVADAKIQVVSATVVSSTQLSVTINIAPDATVDLYDVSVTNPDKKKGIGYLLFEVTQASPITGTEIAYGANDAGEMTGRTGVPGVFYFNTSTGLDTLGSPGRGFDISVDGRTIVGGTTINALNDNGYVYTFDGATWTRTNLPKNPSTTMVRPYSVASDLTTGAATLIGGSEGTGSKGNSLSRRPRLWVLTAGVWTKIDLAAAGTDDFVLDVSPTGIAVGTANGRAAVWAPNGTGGWTLPVLIGPTGSEINGVNTAGTIAVGASGGQAVYWTSDGATWSGPTALSGGCTSAAAVDDLSRILVNTCPKGSRRVPGLIAPPYGAANVTLLGGLGDNASTTIAEDISRGGSIIVGQSTVHNQGIGVYWSMP